MNHATPTQAVSLHAAMADPAFCTRTAQLFEKDLLKHPDKLGDMMWACYQVHPQDASWLDRSILATRNAAEAEQTTTRRAGLHFKLANRLRARFELNHDADDMDDAVASYRQATELTPDGHNERARRLNDMATLLMSRYRRMGRLDDLEDAVSAYGLLVEIVTDQHPVKALALSNHGASLRDRFTLLGNKADLDLSLSSYTRAVELTPDGHPGKPTWLSSLAKSHRTRYEHAGEAGDLEQALVLHRRAIHLTPEGDSDLGEWLDDFGLSLLTHFEYSGELESLEQAIAFLRRATELTLEDSLDQRMRLTHLGLSLLRHFERTGELEDVRQAILAQRRAVELTPDGYPEKPLCWNNLGVSFLRRFERTWDLRDIDQAIANLQRGLETIPESHTEKPTLALNLGNSFLLRYERIGVISDHDRALDFLKLAVEIARKDQPKLIVLYNSFACCLVHEYLRTRDFQTLTNATTTFQKGNTFAPEDDPFLSVSWKNLASAQRLLFEATRLQSDFDVAVQSYMASAMQPTGLPTEHMQSAMLCVSLLTTYPEFSSTDSLMSAQSRIIDVLPEVVWLGHSVKRRFEESAKYGELVNAAVSTAIDAGALKQAVEWLEEGRSLIWSQVLSVRTPLDELRDVHPDLANALEKVQAQLQQSVHTSLIPEANPSTSAGAIHGITANPAAVRHRSLVIEYERLLKRVRSCAGFKHFLRPKGLSALIPSSQPLSGPVVFINVDSSRCDALVLSPNEEITLVPLLELTLKRATKLRKLWGEHLTNDGYRSRGVSRLGDCDRGTDPPKKFLGRIWLWIVKPILEALGIRTHVKDEHLPHVTWCPTGPLMQLPLHAAGLYDEPEGPRVYNYFVSSYTPSLSTLKRGCEKLNATRSVRDVLIVTQPSAPNQTPLPGAAEEGDRLAGALEALGVRSERINGEHATTDRVRHVVNQYPWVHLACHALQNPYDLMKSAFELFDGPLTLTDLMSLVADNAELAFLSACETAMGDEKVPEESAHLAAGMLAVGFKGVIATMWSIQDEDAPIVVEEYYRTLLALRKTEATELIGTGAAHALHEATRVLRETVGESNFMRWASFVHFGV